MRKEKEILHLLEELLFKAKSFVRQVEDLIKMYKEKYD